MSETPEPQMRPLNPAEAVQQPPETPTGLDPQPQHLNESRRIHGFLHVAGRGPKPAKIMFISTSVLEEETQEFQRSLYGFSVKQPAEYLKGPAGNMVKDLLASVGIEMDQCYYTALIKWLHPDRNKRLKPSPADVSWAMPLLLNEIKEVKPDIIVAMGKTVFDALTPGLKLAMKDIQNAWFDTPLAPGARLYPMYEITKPLLRPEYFETFRTDFVELKRMVDQLNGVAVAPVPLNYETVTTIARLAEIIDQEWWVEKPWLMSVDCEWGGVNHIDGWLRYIQFSWKPGRSIVIKFYDENKNYVFDQPYEIVGALLGTYLDQPEVKYVGHHISADLPWMKTWLKLQVFDKTYMDTEFAQQCVDEYESLGAERLAIKFSDLGRYDIPLMLWKKKHPQKEEDGYGYIPDAILEPYAARDVDVVIRAVPHLYKQLQEQELLEYYYNIHLPFVSDTFTSFALTGLPINVKKLDELRELFQYGKDRLEESFKAAIFTEAREIIANRLLGMCELAEVVQIMDRVTDALMSNDKDRLVGVFKDRFGPAGLLEWTPFLDHLICARDFNIRSTTEMRRWLFQVKGFTPIKSTNNKAKGLPSVPWERVEAMPPEAAKAYQPSTDKDTLKILSDKDPLLQQLLELNAVGNICKAFLKEATEDDEGNITRENGLHYWLASDKRIHGQYSCTETGRPRSWRPNVLNIPSWVNDRVSSGLERVLKQDAADNRLPAHLRRYLTEKIPSVRSVVGVGELEPTPGSQGWCIVESDYQTAEIRGLAFRSGDQGLIDIITKPDEQFAIPKDAKSEDDITRLCYGERCGIPPENQNKDLILAKVVKNKIVGHYTRDDLQTGPDGQLLHPKNDLHWSLAEMVQATPREFLNKKKARGAAKVGNFSSAYGASANTLERKIEVDTGSKPEPGTGQRILAALEERQPVATAFLKSMEEVVRSPGYWRAESGRLRHFRTHPMGIGVNDRTRSSVEAALGREGRNFPMQESVASTAARAAKALRQAYKALGLRALDIAVLYDSVVTICPVEERWIVKALHKKCMQTDNNWVAHLRNDDGTYRQVPWNYPIDTEFNVDWSWAPPEDVRAKLADPNWASVPSWVDMDAVKRFGLNV